MGIESADLGNAEKRYSERENVLIDPERYEQHKMVIAVMMGGHMLRHLLHLYHEFDKDLLLPIVLGEIGHHNVRGLYSQEGDCLKARGDIPVGAERVNWMEPTNAFSISMATGIPRETVRRKIDKLVGKGWVTKGPKGEVVITTNVSEYFTADFNRKLLTELLTTSTCITELLHTD